MTYFVLKDLVLLSKVPKLLILYTLQSPIDEPVISNKTKHAF